MLNKYCHLYASEARIIHPKTFLNLWKLTLVYMLTLFHQKVLVGNYKNMQNTE